jgi:hypothetical protein
MTDIPGINACLASPEDVQSVVDTLELTRENASANMEALTSTIKSLPEAPSDLECERPLDLASPTVERRWSPQELAVLRCLNENGDSIAKIATRMRRTKQSIQNQLVAQTATV